MAIAKQAQQFNRTASKSKKPTATHTDNTKYGMGDNYGTGIKAKIGTMRDGTGMKTLSNKKLGTAPKSIA